MDYPDAEILLLCSSEVELEKRVTAVRKEPETVEWIKSLEPGVFWDVGACVGAYSLIAHHLGHRVTALEAAAQNYARLVRNVNMNNADITCLPVAMSERTGTGFLSVSSWEPGAALHSVGDTGTLGHTALTLSAFDLVWFFDQDCPHYLKIDTDGHELSVLKGAEPILGGVRSMLIEQDDTVPGWEEIVHVAGRAGLFVESIHPHGNSGVANVVFRR